MRRSVVAASIVILLIIVFYAGCRFLTKLEVIQITDDLHMLKNCLGGNVGVLKTGAGAVVVDTMTFKIQGAAILKAAETLTGERVVLVVNSHYHFDHTHGNPAITAGTRVVSTARTLEHLREHDAKYWQDEAAAMLPNETFERLHEITLGDKTIRLIHPGRGHTDGDLVVLFVEDRALHAGDLYFNRLYPNIDLKAGGSVREWSGTLEQVLKLDFDHVIPGHGDIADREGMEQFQEFMRELAIVGAQAAKNGWTLRDTISRAVFTADAGYKPLGIPLVMRLDREFVLRRAWEEATREAPSR